MTFSNEELLEKKKKTLEEISKRENWQEEGLIEGEAIPGFNYTLGKLFLELGFACAMLGEKEQSRFYMSESAKKLFESATSTREYRQELPKSEVQEEITIYLLSLNSASIARNWDFAQTIASKVMEMDDLSHYTDKDLNSGDIAYRYYDTKLRARLILDRDSCQKTLEKFICEEKNIDTPYSNAIVETFSGIINHKSAKVESGLKNLIEAHQARVNTDEEHLEDYFDSNILALYTIASKFGIEPPIQSDYLPSELRVDS